MAEPVRVAVLLSGRGSNMLALSEHKRRDPERPYRIALVASNLPEARGLVLAKRLGLPIWAKSHQGLAREEFDAALDEALRAHDVELLALAGYMRLLSDGFVDEWAGRILNIHPSLLPEYKGLDTHRRALTAGDGLRRLLGPSRHLGPRFGPGDRPGQGPHPPARRSRKPRRPRARGGAPALSARARGILPRVEGGLADDLVGPEEEVDLDRGILRRCPSHARCSPRSIRRRSCGSCPRRHWPGWSRP